MQYVVIQNLYPGPILDEIEDILEEEGYSLPDRDQNFGFMLWPHIKGVDEKKVFTPLLLMKKK